ncbi:adenylate/guanylate cyclase domain-containing protein [Leisingera sp. SS27]|uniref:cyclic nucleotide-binding domain-containing protein n=1 Tax=Leisingera sp. SS27 TaxID=2979462 RepID=UPI00232CC117|nr:adenylate/guanylate cyclase domain-containing protein [Leisingera sp. SS27]MDC0660730.1 adenylate/guanylate cyclase domain-containing protein [Leisingera sp. SS27]
MKPKIEKLNALGARYAEAMAMCGLADDLCDPDLLDARPFRFAEGEHLCSRGDPATCLWIVVEGSVAIKEEGHTLFVRRRNEVVGEQHLVGNGYQRIYDLVANETSVEVLVVDKQKIEQHPEAGKLWRNIAKIISIKLRGASRRTASLSQQLADDTRILHAYTNEYALSRRMQGGAGQQTGYAVDRAVIWFSDVVNFSGYTTRTPPERIADIVQRFFNAQTQPIQQHGGHIDKFIGDGLMAFWVLGSAADSSRGTCTAALRAAEEAVAAVAGITIGKQALGLRIGLHAGYVLSGDFGSATRHQFTLIGPEVNKAARLEQARQEDVTAGNGRIGPVRISPELRDELGGIDRKRFDRKFTVQAKNIGTLEFFTI